MTNPNVRGLNKEHNRNARIALLLEFGYFPIARYAEEILNKSEIPFVCIACDNGPYELWAPVWVYIIGMQTPFTYTTNDLRIIKDSVQKQTVLLIEFRMTHKQFAPFLLTSTELDKAIDCYLKHLQQEIKKEEDK